MSKQKRTPWFSANTNPLRTGEYEVSRRVVGSSYPKRTRLRWDGSSWTHTAHSSNGHFAGFFAVMSISEGDRCADFPATRKAVPHDRPHLAQGAAAACGVVEFECGETS